LIDPIRWPAVLTIANNEQQRLVRSCLFAAVVEHPAAASQLALQYAAACFCHWEKLV
jgi:hypothetical protein